MSKTRSRRSCEICGIKEAHLQSSRFFANFPLDENRCREWVRVTGKADLALLPIEKLHTIKHVCGEHFKKTCINKKKNRLKKSAVPSLKLNSAPLSDDQMSEFPLHLWKNQDSQNKNEASTSKEQQGSGYGKATTNPQLVHQQQDIVSQSGDNIVSTSKDGQRANEKSPSLHPEASTAILQPQKKYDSQNKNEASTSKEQQGSGYGKATTNPQLVHQQQDIVSQSGDNIVSTSKDGQRANEKSPSLHPEASTAILQPQKKYVSQSEDPSTSEVEQKADNEKSGSPRRVLQPLDICENKPIDPPVSEYIQIQSRGVKREFAHEDELSPRKKRLVERLVKTKCTLKSLQRSSILIDKIESPLLKELVVNSCKNEKRKPKGRRWTMKHKLSCLAILKRSPKTYRYLSAAVTLPSIKTLQNILKKVPMTPGMNQSVVAHLKTIADSKDPKDRICNLAFDEMALKSRVIYNEGNDIIEGFEDLGDSGRSSELADHALVFLLQGLRQKFKQPLAFYLTKGTISSANLAQIIKTIISQISACGFTVLNTVCDQGPTNMGALKQLREASGPFEDGSNHYFKVDGKNVFIIYDIPHLFKSIRNNFLKAGSVNMNGIKGKWEHLIEVENHNRNFLYFSKITQAHVNPKYKAKMRVKLAAQLLSNTVAAVLKLLAHAESGEKAEGLRNTAYVVEKFDQLLDVTNGPSGPLDIKKNKRQNVSLKTNHMEIWAEYINLLGKTTFVCPSNAKLKNVKCVEGFITSLKSLRDIWWTVKGLGFKYLNLRNLNQDALENLFGVIRQHSPTNRNPTATHFMAALKTAVVTGLTAPHSRGANCENDNKKLLTDFHNFIFGDECGDTATFDESHIILPIETSTDKENEETPIGFSCEVEDIFLVLPEEDITSHDFSLLCEQPTVYVAGYLAKQILKKYDCAICKQYLTVNNPGENPMYKYILLREWWQTKFSLTYPSKNFCETIHTIVNITENELLPQIHKPNICLLGCTLYEAVCPDTCFLCNIHGKKIKSTCFQVACKLLLRRQCQRINQSLASKEEDLASLNKRAEQQGKAK